MNIVRKMYELELLINRYLAAKKGMLTDTDMLYFYNVKGFESRVHIWMKEGSKTFMLTRELVEAFQHTDIPLDMYPSDFQYPFETFLIEGCDCPLFSIGVPGGSADVHAVLYTQDTVVYRDNAMLPTVEGKRVDHLEWNRSLYGIYPGQGGIGLECMSLNMSDTARIIAAVEMTTPSALLPISKEEAQSLVNLFYNTVLYITDPGRDRVETESAGTRKCKTGKPGKKYTSSYILLRPPRSYVPLGHGDGKIIDVRFVVRGHWRNQAIGERHEQHKRIWIKPFWKGPELAELVSKPYLVRK
jgi:hypothetical protein